MSLRCWVIRSLLPSPSLDGRRSSKEQPVQTLHLQPPAPSGDSRVCNASTDSPLGRHHDCQSSSQLPVGKGDGILAGLRVQSLGYVPSVLVPKTHMWKAKFHTERCLCLCSDLYTTSAETTARGGKVRLPHRKSGPGSSPNPRRKGALCYDSSSTAPPPWAEMCMDMGELSS